ncbi:MAG TPA: MFS transporter, partial [Candidatus Dormibacteraeota bacterium]|nr:MFS transporter [Candidatus Dormibacteraeota bacterium]
MSSPPARGGSLWALVAAVFIVETGVFAVVPVLPLYLRDRGVGFGTVGLIVGVQFAVAFALQYPMGRLADRFGRRRFLIAGAVIFAIANGGFVAPLGIPTMVLLRALQGLGVALFIPAASALVADLSAPERRGRAYGWLQAARIGGLTAGPAIGGVVALAGRVRVFELTAAIELLAAVVLLVTVPARVAHHPDEIPDVGETAATVAALRHRQRTNFIGVAAVMAGFTFLFGSYSTIWPLFMRGIGASDATVGLSFTLFGLPLLVVTPVAGWAADRFDRRRLALLGYAGGGICAPLYPLVRSIPLVLLIGVMEASMLAFTEPAIGALVMEDVAPHRRAGVQGGVFAIQSFAEAAGALSGGALFALGP